MTVSLRDDTGNLLGGSQILPGGFGHTAFYTNLLFPLTANRRGTGQVLSPAGKLHDRWNRISKEAHFYGLHRG